ncbi:unnamed protein product [Enterobius vermicularis]|uniref:Secreted protein n=1 Tax=Enterobius vermicularis TaxID=51028 RepID=A0A0N4VGC8_ENTVE|nr:unnamed protein product [Enterobius vermicularis]
MSATLVGSTFAKRFLSFCFEKVGLTEWTRRKLVAVDKFGRCSLVREECINGGSSKFRGSRYSFVKVFRDD